MVSERGVRISHIVLFGLTALAGIVALAISASLVSHYNKNGYPVYHTTAYRDRIRLCLAGAIVTVASCLVLIPGFLFAGTTVAFGLLTHIVPMVISFIIFMIGAASLTALTRYVDCGAAGQGFDRCNIVKGLVIISWIDTIFIVLTIIFLTVLAFIARGRYGVRRSTLYVDA